MVNKILGTLGTKVISSLLAFLVWIINARSLGPENVGTISLIIFSVAVIQLVTNFFCGAAVIYYTSRAGVFRLMIPAYLFSFLIAGVFTLSLTALARFAPGLELIPEGYEVQVAILTVIISITSVNFNLMLGLEWVRKYNYLSLFQVMVAVFVLLIFVTLLGSREVMAYLKALYISWALTFIISIYLLRTEIKSYSLSGVILVMKQVLRFGSWVQIANIFQTFNYRLSLKFTDFFLGRAAVGVLSVGMTLAEGFWIVGRSIATVQFSRLSNQDDFDYSVKLTLTLVKISGIATLLAVVALICVPQSVFLWIFSARFTGIREVIITLAAGIVLLSMSMVLSGFFSGINKPRHNAISSAVGFVFTCILGFWLIPVFGLAGAGIAASISYAAATAYQLVIFMLLAKLKPGDLLLKKQELIQLVQVVKSMKISA